MVQEPYLRSDGGLVKAPNYYIYGRPLARACIWLPYGTKYYAIPQLTGRDISTIMIEQKPGYILSSVYLDINFSEDEMLADLNRLITYTKKNKLKLVIGIDSNAHSSLWGSEETNRRGEILEEWLLTNELFVANVGDSPTFTGRGSNTIVDITVSTMDIQVRDWAVLSSMAKITDHVPITFKIQIGRAHV
mgnify:FL=1